MEEKQIGAATMMNKVKEYFNGSMEPEPASEQEKATDLSIAGRAFQTIGTIVIIASIILIPVIGVSFAITLLGILFIGISIILKTQEQIIQRLETTAEAQSQPSEESTNMEAE